MSTILLLNSLFLEKSMAEFEISYFHMLECENNIQAAAVNYNSAKPSKTREFIYKTDILNQEKTVSVSNFKHNILGNSTR